VSFEYALEEMSYENMVMYGAAIPSYDTDNKKKEPVMESASFDADTDEGWNGFINQIKKIQQ